MLNQLLIVIDTRGGPGGIRQKKLHNWDPAFTQKGVRFIQPRDSSAGGRLPPYLLYVYLC